jgi:hypothetical protein
MTAEDVSATNALSAGEPDEAANFVQNGLMRVMAVGFRVTMGPLKDKMSLRIG